MVERIAVLSENFTGQGLPCLDAVLPDVQSRGLVVVTDDLAAGPQPTRCSIASWVSLTAFPRWQR